MFKIIPICCARLANVIGRFRKHLENSVSCWQRHGAGGLNIYLLDIMVIEFPTMRKNDFHLMSQFLRLHAYSFSAPKFPFWRFENRANPLGTHHEGLKTPEPSCVRCVWPHHSMPNLTWHGHRTWITTCWPYFPCTISSTICGSATKMFGCRM